MRCQRCGKQISSDMVVCPVCNAPISDWNGQLIQDEPMPLYANYNGQHPVAIQSEKLPQTQFWRKSRIVWAVTVSMLVIVGMVILVLTLMSRSQLIGEWRLLSIDGTPTSEEIIWEFSKNGVLSERTTDQSVSFDYVWITRVFVSRTHARTVQMGILR